MLEIKDLHASINGKEILKGINLTVKPGEVHAIMGRTVPERVRFLLFWWEILLLR
jgi:ABC-type hemin transport system ATPase subunit